MVQLCIVSLLISCYLNVRNVIIISTRVEKWNTNRIVPGRNDWSKVRDNLNLNPQYLVEVEQVVDFSDLLYVI